MRPKKCEMLALGDSKFVQHQHSALVCVLEFVTKCNFLVASPLDGPKPKQIGHVFSWHQTCSFKLPTSFQDWFQSCLCLLLQRLAHESWLCVSSSRTLKRKTSDATLVDGTPTPKKCLFKDQLIKFNMISEKSRFR